MIYFEGNYYRSSEIVSIRRVNSGDKLYPYGLAIRLKSGESYQVN